MDCPDLSAPVSPGPAGRALARLADELAAHEVELNEVGGDAVGVLAAGGWTRPR